MRVPKCEGDEEEVVLFIVASLGFVLIVASKVVFIPTLIRSLHFTS